MNEAACAPSVHLQRSRHTRFDPILSEGYAQGNVSALEDQPTLGAVTPRLGDPEGML